MNRSRQGVAFVIVAALAVFAVSAWRAPKQVVVAMPAPTTTDPTTTTSTPVPPTTTPTAVDRDAEIEAIVTDFYFGWFDGIYREDVDILDRVAGSQSVLDQGIRAFGNVEFTAPPSRDALGVEIKDVLLDRPDCLVFSADIDFRSFVDTNEVMPAVDVFFPVGDGWGRAVSFFYEQELWEFECDHMPRR